jgi:formylglycine-generating enzyme required for sulfatase activity
MPNLAVSEMIRIPSGQFKRGAPHNESFSNYDERPLLPVRIAEFELGRNTVTFEQWDAALSLGAPLHKPDDHGWGRGQRPVIDVSWDDAQAYIAWLNHQGGGHFRLPSEAEWEYACRAGTDTPLSFGNAPVEQHAWYGANSDGMTHPVGEKKPNAFGLNDMHGNVLEWCADPYWKDYENAPRDGSVRILEVKAAVTRAGSYIDVDEYSADFRPPVRHYDFAGPPRTFVIRGGCWKSDWPKLRCACRDSVLPKGRYDHLGFRLARTLRSPAA